MTQKRTVSLRLSKDLCDQINVLAKLDDRSFNYMVEKILKQSVKTNDTKAN